MSVDAGIVNQNARTVKKELTDLLKPLNDTLQRLQALRCSVDCVFNFLQDGCNGDGRDQNNKIHQQNFLHNLRDIMHDVLQNCDSLEESVKVIPSSNLLKSPNLTQPLSNLGTLSLDSMSRMEETNPETEEIEEIDLYQHTMHAIGRMHRYRDFATCGDQILQSRALKRSSYPHAHPNSKRSRPINTSHCLQKDSIHKIILTLTRNLELKSVIKSLGGHHRVLQVIIGRTMFVHIILRGLNIDRVFARGIDEEDNLDELDLYTESQYEAMRLITTHASAAVLFFSHRHINFGPQGPPDQSLAFFLRWLKSYRNLFTSSCKRCNRHLQKGLPPTWRDFHNYTPYHFDCRH